MKVKALRYKKEFNKFQEFVIIDVSWGGEPMVLTSETPKLQPETANLEDMQKFYENEDYFEGIELDWNTVELVVFYLSDVNVVGADIRNKLTPPKNLVAMLENYFDRKEINTNDSKALLKLIKKEMKNTKNSVEYLSKLF